MAVRYRGNRQHGFGLWGTTLRLVLSAAVVVVTLGAISSCARRDVTALETRQPALVLEEFFAGDTVAFGIFEDRFWQSTPSVQGCVKRRGDRQPVGAE